MLPIKFNVLIIMVKSKFSSKVILINSGSRTCFPYFLTSDQYPKITVEALRLKPKAHLT